MKISVVWLKRDLRLSDHEPLTEAIQAGLPILIFYCFEPGLVAAPQSSDRHWRFVWESLQDLQLRLKSYQTEVAVFYQEAELVFKAILEEYEVQAVYSHQETGIKFTYDRDLLVNNLLKSKGIAWKEYLQQGVQRGRKNRNRWENLWFGVMNSPLKQPELAKTKWVGL
jgi:deoxyribodipyrimidine photo-lyase